MDIAYVELPTITSINKGFFEKWAGSKKEKEPRLDEIKHKEEGGYFYRPGQAPVHLASELEVIRKSIDRAATELAMHTCKTFVIASDHGASRLAVIHHQEENMTLIPKANIPEDAAKSLQTRIYRKRYAKTVILFLQTMAVSKTAEQQMSRFMVVPLWRK